MCGIAGMLAADAQAAPDTEAVKRMCEAMIHRGPDDHGLREDGPCVLGHRRLSIIDLRPEGAQPMTNEDDSIAVVVNGEICNFQELTKDLEAKGHTFKSKSDSEVILHLYEEEGIDSSTACEACSPWRFGIGGRLRFSAKRMLAQPLHLIAQSALSARREFSKRHTSPTNRLARLMQRHFRAVMARR